MKKRRRRWRSWRRDGSDGGAEDGGVEGLVGDVVGGDVLSGGETKVAVDEVVLSDRGAELSEFLFSLVNEGGGFQKLQKGFRSRITSGGR